MTEASKWKPTSLEYSHVVVVIVLAQVQRLAVQLFLAAVVAFKGLEH